MPKQKVDQDVGQSLLHEVEILVQQILAQD